jgi:hypothetical protein
MTPAFALVAAVAALLASALGTLAAFKGWRGWLDLRREQLLSGGGPESGSDLAELKRRVRRLGAIASGTE